MATVNLAIHDSITVPPDINDNGDFDSEPSVLPGALRDSNESTQDTLICFAESTTRNGNERPIGVAHSGASHIKNNGNDRPAGVARSSASQCKPSAFSFKSMLRKCKCIKYAQYLREEHQDELARTKPEVAMLVPATIVDDESEQPCYDLPADMKLCASASLRFHGVPGKLLVMQLDADSEFRDCTPSAQLSAMLAAISSWNGNTLENTVPWPLHEPRVSAAMLAREAEVLVMEAESWWCSQINRLLHLLRIFSPDEDGPVLNAYRDHYGQAFEFQTVWAYFYVQMLWLMIPFVLIALLFDFKPAVHGSQRAKFEVVKVLVIMWGVCVAVVGASRYQGHQAIEEMERRQALVRRTSSLNIAPRGSRRKRLAMLFGVAIPCLLVLIYICLSTLGLVTNLILHIIYVWGDCYNKHTVEKPCRDAEQKHGKLGWAAEVGCDVLLAIVFELFFAIGKTLAAWISSLLAFEHQSDSLLFQQMLEVFLAALERIGFVGSLAFGFAPQWEKPHGGKDTIDMSIDCSDLFFGQSDYQCFQRRLPASLRRWLLESLMKGPFMVAPFIAILIKTIIPMVIYHLSNLCDYATKCPGGCFCLYPLRFIVRFFTLIFSLDGDNVGCFKFAIFGWPFTEICPDRPPADVDDGKAEPLREYKHGVISVLEQSVRKPFEPEDELMELEMSFLWVLFFTPLRPFGAITTLIAKVLEINFDLLKALHVRRRAFPRPDKIMRREQTAFVNAALLGSVGWTLGISLITYNDDFHRWSFGSRVTIYIAVVLWLLLSAGFGFTKKANLGCGVFYARFIHPFIPQE